MDIPILKDITVIFLVATASLLLCSRLKIPGILGYLITGLLVGPNGFGLISNIESVDIMAEMGVVLLLFTIGLEFSLAQLISLRRLAIGGGILQVILTVAIFTFVYTMIGADLNKAVFLGMLISLSSTAIVLKLLAERAEVEAPYGRATTAILIFQDIAVIPMMLITPMLAATGDTSVIDIFLTLGKAVAIVVVLFLGARFIVPHLLSLVTKTKSRELFLLSIVLICMAVAFITNQAGLSLALGAFLAGMVVSETGYGYQALGNVVPFKDVFTGFFFVSVGMLIDVNIFIANPVYVFGIALMIIAIKAVVAAVVINLIGYPINISTKTGLALAQIGEFSFILAATGALSGILTEEEHSTFIAISVLTMAATPFLIQYGAKISNLTKKLPLPERIKQGYFFTKNANNIPLKDHIIIVGYGVAGRNIAKAALNAHIKFNVIEMNPRTVHSERELGTPIIYGDAAQEEVLKHAKLETARTLVISGADNNTARNIVETVHRLNPTVAIIVRSKYLGSVNELKELGAKDVITDEAETTVALLSSVLKLYYVPLDYVDQLEAEIRNIEPDKVKRRSRDKAATLGIKGVSVETVIVPVGSSLSTKSLREIDARFRFSVNIIAVRSGDNLHVSPGSSYYLSDRDELLVTGKQTDIARFAVEFNK